MPARRDPAWDKPADLIKRYERGREVVPTDPPEAPLPPPARVPSRADPLEAMDHALEKTDKRLKWLAGIGGAFVGAAVLGWQAQAFYQQATHYYATAAAAASIAGGAASAAADTQVRAVTEPLAKRTTAAEQRLDTLDRDVRELRDRVDHATTPGRKRLYPAVPSDGGTR